MTSAPNFDADPIAYAREMTGAIIAHPSYAPEFSEKLAALSSIGIGAMLNVSADAEKLSDFAISRGLIIEETSRSMDRLQNVLQRLSPRNSQSLLNPHKAFGFFKKKPDFPSYFDLFRHYEQAIESALTALGTNRDQLYQRTIALDNMRGNIAKNADKISATRRLCGEIIARAEKLSKDLTPVDPDKANKLATAIASDLQPHSVTLLQSEALAHQNLNLISLLKQQNIDFIDHISSAIGATITALKTAVIASKSITSQDLIFQSIGTVNRYIEDDMSLVAPDSPAGVQRMEDLNAGVSNVFKAVAAFYSDKTALK